MLKTVRNLAIAAAVTAAGYGIYQHQQEILDWYYLRNYVPPTAIAQLAEQAQLTSAGQRIFYRSRPQIDIQRADLVRDCKIKSDKTIELGCYLSTNQIYLLSISQPQLKDEIAVTAAHETLHAAYGRLSNKDRRELNAELEAAAAKIPDDSLKKRLAEYQDLEPGEQDNELHSILGTEYPNLSPELEAHYATYLADRAHIVKLSQSFNQNFDGLHTEIVQLDAQIIGLKRRMQTHREAGRISAYNALVPQVNGLIKDYNAKVVLYNQYASDLLGVQSAAGSE